MFNHLANTIGRLLVHYLNRPKRRYESFAVSDPERLAAVLATISRMYT